jgi:hypothetical protein
MPRCHIVCHVATRRRALITLIDARFHGGVCPGDLFAIFGTRFADFRTQVARPGMIIGTAQHEIGARLADLRAIEQHPNMRGRGMVATHLQTMRDKFQTQVMTHLAVFDTVFYCRGRIVLYGHSSLSSLNHNQIIVTKGAARSDFLGFR